MSKVTVITWITLALVVLSKGDSSANPNYHMDARVLNSDEAGKDELLGSNRSKFRESKAGTLLGPVAKKCVWSHRYLVIRIFNLDDSPHVLLPNELQSVTVTVLGRVDPVTKIKASDTVLWDLAKSGLLAGYDGSSAIVLSFRNDQVPDLIRDAKAGTDIKVGATMNGEPFQWMTKVNDFGMPYEDTAISPLHFPTGAFFRYDPSSEEWVAVPLSLAAGLKLINWGNGQYVAPNLAFSLVTVGSDGTLKGDPNQVALYLDVSGIGAVGWSQTLWNGGNTEQGSNGFFVGITPKLFEGIFKGNGK